MSSMPQTSELSIRYDSKSVWLHWATAVLVVLLWIAGQTIDWFPRGVPRDTVTSLHISFGVVLGLILFYRIWWRSTAGASVPGEGQRMVQVAATLVHWALYISVVGAVALGVANTWVRGETLFNLFTVPAFDPGNRALRRTVGHLHEWFANAVIILAALHAAAGLFHHYVWKDNVLRRMLPQRRS